MANQERFFDEGRFIVSKTDAKGIIQYANDVFLDIAEYREEEVLGQPHNLIRHPDMPRGVFKLMWERLKAGHEIFAYVINSTKHGDYYWVFAHVTPSYNAEGAIIGYHSNRRVPSQAGLGVMKAIYKELLEVERAEPTPQKATQAGYNRLMEMLQEQGKSYDEFIFSI